MKSKINLRWGDFQIILESEEKDIDHLSSLAAGFLETISEDRDRLAEQGSNKLKEWAG